MGEFVDISAHDGATDKTPSAPFCALHGSLDEEQPCSAVEYALALGPPAAHGVLILGSTLIGTQMNSPTIDIMRILFVIVAPMAALSALVVLQPVPGAARHRVPFWAKVAGGTLGGFFFALCSPAMFVRRMLSARTNVSATTNPLVDDEAVRTVITTTRTEEKRVMGNAQAVLGDEQAAPSDTVTSVSPGDTSLPELWRSWPFLSFVGAAVQLAIVVGMRVSGTNILLHGTVRELENSYVPGVNTGPRSTEIALWCVDACLLIGHVALARFAATRLRPTVALAAGQEGMCKVTTTVTEETTTACPLAAYGATVKGTVAADGRVLLFRRNAPEEEDMAENDDSMPRWLLCMAFVSLILFDFLTDIAYVAEGASVNDQVAMELDPEDQSGFADIAVHVGFPPNQCFPYLGVETRTEGGQWNSSRIIYADDYDSSSACNDRVALERLVQETSLTACEIYVGADRVDEHSYQQQDPMDSEFRFVTGCWLCNEYDEDFFAECKEKYERKLNAFAVMTATLDVYVVITIIMVVKEFFKIIFTWYAVLLIVRGAAVPSWAPVVFNNITTPIALFIPAVYRAYPSITDPIGREFLDILTEDGLQFVVVLVRTLYTTLLGADEASGMQLVFRYGSFVMSAGTILFALGRVGYIAHKNSEQNRRDTEKLVRLLVAHEKSACPVGGPEQAPASHSWATATLIYLAVLSGVALASLIIGSRSLILHGEMSLLFLIGGLEVVRACLFVYVFSTCPASGMLQLIPAVCATVVMPIAVLISSRVRIVLTTLLRQQTLRRRVFAMSTFLASPPIFFYALNLMAQDIPENPFFVLLPGIIFLAFILAGFLMLAFIQTRAWSRRSTSKPMLAARSFLFLCAVLAPAMTPMLAFNTLDGSNQYDVALAWYTSDSYGGSDEFQTNDCFFLQGNATSLQGTIAGQEARRYRDNADCYFDLSPPAGANVTAVTFQLVQFRTEPGDVVTISAAGNEPSHLWGNRTSETVRLNATQALVQWETNSGGSSTGWSMNFLWE